MNVRDQVGIRCSGTVEGMIVATVEGMIVATVEGMIVATGTSSPGVLFEIMCKDEN